MWWEPEGGEGENEKTGEKGEKKYKNTGNKVGNDKTDKIYDVHRNDGWCHPIKILRMTNMGLKTWQFSNCFYMYTYFILFECYIVSHHAPCSFPFCWKLFAGKENNFVDNLYLGM